MNKFWPIVAVLMAVGLIALLNGGSQDIEFTDLETECRYDRGSSTDIDLEKQRLRFEGHFPVENPGTDLSLDYSKSDDRITLDVVTEGQSPVENFLNNCRAVAVYDTETGKIQPGRYLVTVKHDGEEASRSVVRIE